MHAQDGILLYISHIQGTQSTCGPMDTQEVHDTVPALEDDGPVWETTDSKHTQGTMQGSLRSVPWAQDLGPVSCPAVPQAVSRGQ